MLSRVAEWHRRMKIAFADDVINGNGIQVSNLIQEIYNDGFDDGSASISDDDNMLLAPDGKMPWEHY